MEPVADRDALLAKAMKALTLEDGAEVSVAVSDIASGESAAYGEGAFDTASIVKVDILAALLLQAQDADRHLTATEKTYATAMITNSDNVSASALWDIIGQADGLDAANERFGLTATAGGDGALWGLTQTTAADQLTLIQQVFGDDSELSEASRTYLQGLMGEIAADQHWGCRRRPTAPSGPSRTGGWRGVRPGCGTSTASGGSLSTGTSIWWRRCPTATRPRPGGSRWWRRRRRRRWPRWAPREFGGP